MARARWLLKRSVRRGIYHVATSSFSRRLLRPQHSPRCILVVVDSEPCRSNSGILEKTIRERMDIIVDALKNMLDELPCVRPEPCIGKWCDGYMYRGIRVSTGRIHLLISRMKDSRRKARLLCHSQNIVKYGLFGEKEAAWHREGPPNNAIFCWNNNCCVAAQ